MKKLRFFFMLAVMALGCLLSGCRDRDHIPSVDRSDVPADYLLGGWAVTGSHVYWKLTAFGTSINNIYNFKKLIAEKIEEETEDESLFFNSNTAFYIRHKPDDIPPYVRQSEYLLNSDTAGYKLKFTSNPEVLSFYAPMVYIKKQTSNPNGLTIYLRRGEVLDMLDKDGSISSSYMSMIRSNVDDAVVEIYLERDTLPIYEQITAEFGY